MLAEIKPVPVEFRLKVFIPLPSNPKDLRPEHVRGLFSKEAVQRFIKELSR